MAFPTVGNSHSGSLIPTIWAANFLRFFYMSTVLAAVSNTDYEGVVKEHGDKVEVNILVGGQSREYVDGQDLEYDEPESQTRTMLIDKGEYFAFNASYITKSQALKSLKFIEKWTDHYAQITKRSIEHKVLSAVVADVDAFNCGSNAGADTQDINLGAVGTPKSLVKTDIIDDIVDWGDVLDQQNIPDDGRFIVLPTWACALIKKSELRDASIMGDNVSVLRNGRIGMIDRFEIYSSRNLATGIDVGAGNKRVTNALFGHKSAISFATQLTKQERFMNPQTFGEQIRSLQSYGVETFQPTALGNAYVTKG